MRGVLGWLLDIGTLVNDRYRVSAVLGKGGFGVTYLVDDLRLHGKRRALKEVPELYFDEYETRLLGRLTHPAIPDITDRFSADGMVYQVLEFGGDRTLRTEQERRGGRIPLFVLLPWVQQLCEALQYLHVQDPPVVHRDLKPENVLLDEHERVMLIDFGIAKEAATDTMTRTIGRAVTQGFSPPEQVLGTGTDARSDVYALGAILYFCLTGQMPPAAHERVTGTAIKPLSSVLPDIPPLIESAVMQALELNINLRQQSIPELASVFELIQSGSSSARTVLAPPGGGATADTAGLTLPSVQLPSHRTGGTAPATSIRVAQPPMVEPKSRRNGALILASSLLLGGTAAGGYWLWVKQVRSPDPEITTVPETRSIEATSTIRSDAAANRPDSAAAPTAAGAQEPSPPVTVPVKTPADMTAVVPATSGPASASATKTPRPAPSLPSVFSNEQPKEARSTTGEAKPKQNLMELFEVRRRAALSTSTPEKSANVSGQPPATVSVVSPPTPEPVLQPTPTPKISTEPKVTTKPKVKAKPKVTAKPKVAARPKPTPRPKRKTSSSSDWGFQYKGARKTD
ncbi:protein kinase [Thiorhodococcus fuscus]|uniref:non-specific serine/threonine protein kinase n=1 Tax=Thiorhodococcus fuscus TaxID=527200 RepID=A0ABW4Y7S2_9GAMM